MNFLRLYFFLQVVVFSQTPVLGQNIVPNGGFEDYGACPGSYSVNAAGFRVHSWRSINTATPDYFNTCSEGEASVPYNWAGVSDAFEGYGYAGIYTWMNLEKPYREYLHCKLTTPLIKDSLYQVEFRYKLSSYSKFATDRIGLMLSDTLPTFPHDRPLDMKPSLSFVKDSALTLNTGAWETAIASYRAIGNEQYLTIGNFFDNKDTRVYHIRFRPESQPMLTESAYYYIDDVRVVPAFFESLPPGDILPVFTGDDTMLNTIYVLKNIQFSFNSYALLPVAYPELKKVADYLSHHPGVRVRLSGHTDDSGTARYNRILSANRAKSAAAYLISQGIDKKRISTFGYGETRPLVAGDTDADRLINRRVEIEFHR